MSESADSAVAPLPRVPAAGSTSEIEVRRSKFITTIEPVHSLAEANDVIAAVRRRWWDARHHCTAIVIGDQREIQRSSDDGEPAGTAGVPMLETLRAHAVTDIIAVVTRYFGGTLLGVGGLIRAYSRAVQTGLAATVLLRQRVVVPCEIAVEHAWAGRVEHALRTWCAARAAEVAEVAYGERAVFRLLVPPAELTGLCAEVAAVTGGAVLPTTENPIVVARP